MESLREEAIKLIPEEMSNTLIIYMFSHFSTVSLIATQVCERLGWLARSESYIH